MKKSFITGLTALLLSVATQDLDAKNKPTEKISQQGVEQKFSEPILQTPTNRATLEYKTTLQGDVYSLQCWSTIVSISDQETWAMMKNLPLVKGDKCLDHFYFKEEGLYCSFEHSFDIESARRNFPGFELSKSPFEQKSTPYQFSFAHGLPAGVTYALSCGLPMESKPEERHFKDITGNECVLTKVTLTEIGNKN